MCAHACFASILDPATVNLSCPLTVFRVEMGRWVTRVGHFLPSQIKFSCRFHKQKQTNDNQKFFAPTQLYKQQKLKRIDFSMDLQKYIAICFLIHTPKFKDVNNAFEHS